MTEISSRNLRCYNEQYWYGKHFVKDFLDIDCQNKLRVLEVGTAEGGLLKYFSEFGLQCYGLENSKNRYENSIQLNSNLDIEFIYGDITKISPDLLRLSDKIDIVICRDVIEHIDSDIKYKALQNMYVLLKPGGRMFISFPPKYSPYAGHQQVAPRLLAKLPYIHCFPDSLYANYLSVLGVNENVIKGLLRTKHTRLSINRFEAMIDEIGFSIVKKEFYFIRPCYESRFNIKRRKHGLSSSFIREIITLGAIYLLTK